MIINSPGKVCIWLKLKDGLVPSNMLKPPVPIIGLLVFHLYYQPFKPSRYIKASSYIPENRLNFPTIRGFRMKISMKLVY